MKTAPQLTIEEKRQAVYSALYRYAAEAIPLRQRAIHRVVLGALLGSNEGDPFRIGRIQANLCFGSDNLKVRSETIQEALDQLIQEGKVAHVLLRERHAYYLTLDGEAAISSLTVSSAQLFHEVEEHLFRDTTGFLPADIASQIFRRFAFECFARFGLQIARSTTGTITRDELVKQIDIYSAFEAAVNDLSISSEQKESLGARCHQFLISSDPVCERLKFYLTQGYYFTQLVGLEHAKFNPLAEQAFSGAVFYLDTNVLLVLTQEDAVSQFAEMIRLAQQLCVELRVSRATITEARRVILDRMQAIRKIVDTLPTELAERTNDQILKAFYQARDVKPDLTPEEFFRPFDELEARLRKEWAIVIDEREADEYHECNE
jgi:hypothetical protein